SRGRAAGAERFQASKVVVLGAGMMGAAIAYVCAKAGIEVVLKDVSLEAAQRGKGYSEKLVAKGVERGKVTQDQGDALLARITEGIAMLTEGIPAATIEQASSQAGYPAPVLQLSDELNLKLMRKIRNAAKAAADGATSGWDAHPAEQVIDRMLDEFDRPGKLE